MKKILKTMLHDHSQGCTLLDSRFLKICGIDAVHCILLYSLTRDTSKINRVNTPFFEDEDCISSG